MKTKWLSLIFFLSFSNASLAVDRDYKLCTIGGYFSGAGDKFLSGLAGHTAKKRHFLDDPICTAAWENAYRIGEKLAKTGKIKDQADQEVVHQATVFSTKVYEAISSRIDF
ncbi:MAG: hypothetical protein H0X43_12840 [Nitrosospira sp.]|nr:hypothetical protein [Nitrosospira sp.]